MKEIDVKELSKYNGKDGNPVYVVHQGRVFDVTESQVWKSGVHMGRHDAGADLTTDIEAAPHGPDFLERYPQVGVLKKEAATAAEAPTMLSGLLKRFPVLRRHPHPMTVHFPIVFMFSAAIFTLLYLITEVSGFEITAMHCLGAGLLFIPLAMATGYCTWWLNYGARPMRAVSIKKRLSFILLGVDIVVFMWRVSTPDILTAWRGESWIYLILVLAFLPIVTVIGWYGASLTFPLKKE